MIKKLFFLPALIFFLLTMYAFAQQSDETDFRQKLKQYLTALKSQGNKQDSLAQLWRFSDYYPNSKYADDAQYVILWLNMGKDVDLVKWEAFVERFPEGKLEPITLEALKDSVQGINNSFTLSELRLPYKAALLNARSMDAMMRKDYGGVIKYSSELIAQISKTNNDYSETITFNYVKILTSYKHLNNRAEFDRVKEEAIKMLPEKKERFEEFWK